MTGKQGHPKEMCPMMDHLQRVARFQGRKKKKIQARDQRGIAFAGARQDRHQLLQQRTDLSRRVNRRASHLEIASASLTPMKIDS
jgi:hypothetical protein